MANKAAACYPPPEARQEWNTRADELDMSLSEYIEAMTEAGRKKFQRRTSGDKSNTELRQQNDELRQELKRMRERVNNLESQLYKGERQSILSFLEDQHEATYTEISAHLKNTVSQRLTSELGLMMGDKIQRDGDTYTLITEDEPEVPDAS